MTADDAHGRLSPRHAVGYQVAVAVALGVGVVGLIVVGGGHPGLTLLAVAVVAVVVALRDVRVALVLLTMFTFVRGGDIAEKIHGVPSPQIAFAIAVLVVARPWQYLGTVRGAALVEVAAAIVAYGAVIIASVPLARDLEEATESTTAQVKAMLVAAAVAAAVVAVRSVRPFVWGLILAGLVVGAVVTFQSVTATFDNDYLGLAVSPVAAIAGGAAEPRAGGPLGSPNFFAQMMVVVVAVALERFRHDPSRRARAVAGVSALVSAASVVFSFSRGGFVALVVVVGWMAFARPRNRALVAAVVVSLALVPVVAGDFVQRLGQVSAVTELGSGQRPSDGAIAGRAAEMLAATQMFGDHPIVGVGIGQFNVRYQDYARSIALELRREERSAHSLPLEIAAETGIIGLLVFGGIVVATVTRLSSMRRRLELEGRPDEAGLLFGLLVGLAGYFVCSLILHSAFPELMWMLIGTGIACGTMSRPLIANAPASGVEAVGTG